MHENGRDLELKSYPTQSSQGADVEEVAYDDCRLCRVVRRILCLKLKPVAENFLRRIDIEVVQNGVATRRAAMALLDTGCPKNLMSGKLASNLGIKIRCRPGIPLFEGVGGGEFRTVGQVTGRWSCKDQPGKSRLGFDPKYYDGIWEISDNYNERYDVIIGRETITRYDLFKVKRELAGPVSYRHLPEQIDCMYSIQV